MTRVAAPTSPSATALATDGGGQVLDDWTGGYRDTFVAGMDGDPQSSVDAIVNELIFRVTEVDDQGLRALVEAASPDELPANRSDGPAAFHAAELRAPRWPAPRPCSATTSTTAACSPWSQAVADTADAARRRPPDAAARRWTRSPTR